jgi:chemotaxis methyl-accepting protein methylase
LIYDESGITFSSTNRSILESRLKERLREKQLTELATYYSTLLRDKEELKLMLDSVTTNLTRFSETSPTSTRSKTSCFPPCSSSRRKRASPRSGFGAPVLHRGRTLYPGHDTQG